MNGERTHVHGRRRHATMVLACAGALLSALGAAPVAHADLSPFVTDGPVYAITSTGGNTFIGGAFSHVGLRSGGGVALDRVSGQAHTPVAAEVAGGEIDATVSDGAGGWYIGGGFSTVADQPRSGLAHIRADGSLDPGFAPNPNGTVRALAVGPAGSSDAGLLYVGGSFTQMAGQHRGHVAALRPDGSLVADWVPDADLDVRALVAVPVKVDVTTTTAGTPSTTPGVQMTVIFTGGDFGAIGSESSQSKTFKGLAALWGSGATGTCTPAGSPPACTANQVGGQNVHDSGGSGIWGTNVGGGSVHALAVGQPYLINSTSADPCPPPPATSEACTLSAAIYVGTANSATAVAAFPFNLTVSVSGSNSAKPGTVASNPFGSISGWSPATDSGATVRVLSLSPPPNYATPVTTPPTNASTPPVLYVGGSFSTLAGDPHANLGALQGVTDPTPNTSVTNAAPSYKSWSPSADASVNALALGSGPIVYAGGDFASLCPTAPPCGSPTRAIAGALGGVTTQSGTGNAATLDPWDARLAGGSANTLALAGTTIFAGGSFTAVAAQPRSNLAAFDSGGQLLSWSPAATITQTTTCTANSAAGTVTCTGSTPANPATTSCTVTGTATSPPPCAPPAIPSSVRALVARTGTVYAGGTFDHVQSPSGSNAIVNLAALDTATGNPAAGFTPPNPNDQVLALSLTSESLYFGGAFGGLTGGVSRSRLAAVDPGSGAVQGWNPAADDNVYSLSASCANVYVGGSFQNVGGQPRDRIAALDTASGQAGAWDPQSDSTVLTLARTGATIYAGGSFSLIGSALRAHVAALDADTAKATDWNPYSDYTVRALALDGSTVYVGGTFTNVGGADRANLAGLDAATGQATSFNPGADASVYALHVAGPQLSIGGAFSNLGTRTQQGFAAVTADNDVSGQVEKCTAPARPIPPATGGPPGGGSPPPASPVVPKSLGSGANSGGPLISAFDIVPRRFRVATTTRPPARRSRRRRPVWRDGARFRFTLDQRAVVTISISAPARRAISPGACARATAPTPSVPRCLVMDHLGSLSQSAKAGANSIFFTGRLRGHPLKPGTYLATITAKQGSSNGAARTTTFRVLAPRPTVLRKRRRATARRRGR